MCNGGNRQSLYYAPLQILMDTTSDPGYLPYLEYLFRFHTHIAVQEMHQQHPFWRANVLVIRQYCQIRNSLAICRDVAWQWRQLTGFEVVR